MLIDHETVPTNIINSKNLDVAGLDDSTGNINFVMPENVQQLQQIPGTKFDLEPPNLENGKLTELARNNQTRMLAPIVEDPSGVLANTYLQASDDNEGNKILTVLGSLKVHEFDKVFPVSWIKIKPSKLLELIKKGGSEAANQLEMIVARLFGVSRGVLTKAFVLALKEISNKFGSFQ
jgi:hypothetical protein